ncbi:hypothetical protein BK634_19890 [Pseudomonas chlororaphis]|jgi:hypothetical protein|uniref:DUF2188 domain-containing protein n=1 Tax=Pseudomonas morbosilactucae TaxID=2938197 RepID=A0A9X2C9I8_9PSED|nr:hypothetical protein [Pseudomonas morbosilactucae]MCK9801339.1 hypothetical protein [Pseudomonas morbosilactucae]MCK9818103.1 hypothetical protein [Pseudomonas morbosilactucae]ROL69984.1 hypothetical protein BK634_19890 [Pseudomonas chlororaphis]WEK07517.1 MAG: hypothetical protein P0Y51_19830 [Pseudomonas sp.]
MSAAKSVNGYLITPAKDGQWWVATTGGENIAGPFPSEAMAIEVAAVLQDQPPPPSRRRTSKP